MVIAALALSCLFGLSQWHKVPFGYFSHPPIYGVWKFVLSPWALLLVPSGVGLALISWLVTSSRRISTWAALLLLIVAGTLTAMCMALVRGDTTHLVRGVSTTADSPYYATDLHFVYRLGVRGFSNLHPDLISQFHSVSVRTHPPGALVLVYELFRTLGSSHPLRITTAIASLGFLAAIPAWGIGRLLGGDRAGRIAAVLFVAAPGPLLFAYTSLDVVFATGISAAICCFMVASRTHSTAWAAGAGFALGVTTYVTYATSFIVVAIVISLVVELRSARIIARLLGAAALAGAVVLAFGRFVLSTDLIRSYFASPVRTERYDPYWIIGSPLAWLILAGIPLAGLGAKGIFVAGAKPQRAVLPGVIMALMLVWACLPGSVTHLRAGEVERTWSFLYPVLAGAAAPLVDRYTSSDRQTRGIVVAGLAVLAISQAALIQMSWDTFF